MQHSPNRGDKFADFTLLERIARGGNGEVWSASDSVGSRIAIKFLMKIKQIAYTRFRSEVKILRDVAGIAGILPVIASDLPEDVGERRAWYSPSGRIATSGVFLNASSMPMSGLCATAENQQFYDVRWRILSEFRRAPGWENTPIWIIYEPAIGPVTMRGFDLKPDWIIFGGEIGSRRARWMLLGQKPSRASVRSLIERFS